MSRAAEVRAGARVPGSVLAVADPGIWAELDAVTPLDGHVLEVLGPLRRRVADSFAREGLPELERHGISVLVRYARRRRRAEREDGATAARVAALDFRARPILHEAQRHAVDGVVRGFHAWDPEHDAPAVRVLHAAGLLVRDPEDPSPDYQGRWFLDPDLPPPPPRGFDASEAVMPPTEDLAEPRPGPMDLLQDMAGLAAAIGRVTPRLTHKGTVSRADARRLGRRLGVPELATDGVFEDHARWLRALQGLQALGAVSVAPIERELFVDLGIEELLEGGTPDAIDRLLRRMVEPDLHPLLPLLRQAFAAAGDQALDTMILSEELRDQHRDVLFPAWARPGGAIYPRVEGERARPYDDAGWARVEERLLGRCLKKLEHLGLVRRAPGVVAATLDGRVWAGRAVPQPKLWAGADLELVVAPGSVTPWERFQIERLTRCLGRDVVDRHVLERDALLSWLSTHELDEALELLRRRCLVVPEAVEATLRSWAEAGGRVVLLRGAVE